MYSDIKNSIRNIRNIRRDLILLVFIVSMTFLWCNGFNLSIFELGNNFAVLKLIRIFAILLATGFSVLFARQGTYSKNYYFQYIMGMLLIILFPTIINLVIVNALSPKGAIISLNGYFGFCLFILLISHRIDSNFVTKLNAIVLTMATVSMLSLIVLSRFPAVADRVFVRTVERFDSIRLAVGGALGAMISYSTFYSLVMSTKIATITKKRIFYFLLFCAFMWYHFAVAMGRMTIFALIIVLCYYWFFHSSNIRKVYVASALLIFLVLLVVVPRTSPIVDKVRLSYTSIIKDYNIEVGGVTQRKDGIQYYLKEFCNTNYLGLGLISTYISENSPIGRGRTQYRYNPNDHGIFAVLYQFGFPAIVLTTIILFRMFRDLAVIRRRGPPEHQTIAMGIHLYLCFCILGLHQIFWKPTIPLWVGLMFFMVWRMSEDVKRQTVMKIK